jgi:hypothetical protein
MKEYTEKWSNASDNSNPTTIMDCPTIEITSNSPTEDKNPLARKGSLLNIDNILFNQAKKSRLVILVSILVHATRCLVSYRYQVADREKITTTYGRDIATYLVFQQKMIYATCLCALVACIMVIPVNLTGT